MAEPERLKTPTSAIARGYAWLLIRLRYPVLAFWIGALVYAAFFLPTPTTSSDNLVSLIPEHAPALGAQQRLNQLFRVPFNPDTAVVERRASGLSMEEQARAVEHAKAADDRAQQAKPGPGRYLALPAINTAGAVPGSRESNTTAITYLTFDPLTSFVERESIGHAYAEQAEKAGQPVVGVTGIVPGQLHEGRLIEDALPWIEAATVALIALLVGLKFRSPTAPLLTLLTVGIAYILGLHVLRQVGDAAGFTLPSLLEPLMVALVLGISTDYAIFYLSCARAKLLRGEPRVRAAEEAAAEISPIVLAGGIILAAGLASLEVAHMSFFRTLGPGLAVTVLVAVLVAVTFIPAALAVFGRLLFWPYLRPGAEDQRPAAVAVVRRRERIALFMTRRVPALVAMAVCGAVLVLGAVQLRHLALGFTEISGLPDGAQEKRAADAVSQGFAAGMLSPSQLLVEGDGLGAQRGGLVRLEQELDAQPGVAAVLGPREGTGSPAASLVYASSGNAARYLVVFDHDPFGARAISTIRGLEGNLPSLLQRAGLSGAHATFAGDTALAEETIRALEGDVLRITVAVLAVNFLLLALFLRALVAPLFLVATSVLAVAGTLGLTSFVFQRLLGHGELTYFVPFAAGVLLVSLGSDYNVFVAGRVWQEAQARPLREAIAVAVPRAASAIRAAGITLSLSFVLLAIIPVRGFWEFAFAMAAGILVETFVVRSLLVPALVSLFGYLSGWPGGRLRRRRPAVADDSLHA